MRIAIVGAALALCLAGRAAAGEVVVLRGGVAIELKQPWVIRGGSALLTRKDGTLLSVPVSEIDLKATAAAKSKSASPPARTRPASRSAATPAVAAKVSRNLPKSKVRITDAQVTHTEAAAPGTSEKAEGRSWTGAARVEVPQYDQERAGTRLYVRGTLRNSGAAPAQSLRMSVHVLDGKGETIASTDARLSRGMIEPGRSVDFTATLEVGENFVGSIRFFPQWAGAPQGMDTR
ncbi:MAG: FxLYD domain-containing protein [Acidobacteriota bacterium]|nr:FxLYD domain-containing protein [Acidobacteriota bacterium]MDQ2978669.1 FxLYD domain-containing protein [Acidobacteriota bacterium]